MGKQTKLSSNLSTASNIINDSGQHLFNDKNQKNKNKNVASPDLDDASKLEKKLSLINNASVENKKPVFWRIQKENINNSESKSKPTKLVIQHMQSKDYNYNEGSGHEIKTKKFVAKTEETTQVNKFFRQHQPPEKEYFQIALEEDEPINGHISVIPKEVVTTTTVKSINQVADSEEITIVLEDDEGSDVKESKNKATLLDATSINGTARNTKGSRNRLLLETGIPFANRKKNTRSKSKASHNFTDMLTGYKDKQVENRPDIKATKEHKGIDQVTSSSDTLQSKNNSNAKGMEQTMKFNDTVQQNGTSAFILPRNGHMFKGTARNTANFSKTFKINGKTFETKKCLIKLNVLSL
jgi:hypothetical protein